MEFEKCKKCKIMKTLRETYRKQKAENGQNEGTAKTQG